MITLVIIYFRIFILLIYRIFYNFTFYVNDNSCNLPFSRELHFSKEIATIN